MSNLVSIIVPIYNASQTLQLLLDSIYEQTYKNYELILINDGSTDESENICLFNKKKDSRIHYYKKKNSGVSETRNYGLSLIKGKYVCFVDSDDFLEKDYLMDLVKTLIESNSQLCCCNYQKINMKNSNIKYEENNSKLTIEKIYDSKNKYNLLYDKYSGYLWNKIFISSIILDNKICFSKEVFMTEDMLFVFEYLKYADKVSCINKKNYKYRISNFSASKRIDNKKWFSIFKTFDIIIEHNNAYDYQFFSKISYSYLFYLYEAKYRLKHIKKDKDYNNLKFDIDSRLKSTKIMFKNLSYKCKLKIFIYKHFNTLAFRIKKRKECM